MLRILQTWSFFPSRASGINVECNTFQFSFKPIYKTSIMNKTGFHNNAVGVQWKYRGFEKYFCYTRCYTIHFQCTHINTKLHPNRLHITRWTSITEIMFIISIIIRLFDKIITSLINRTHKQILFCIKGKILFELY